MTAIFRGYDQAALDRQYNNRARVADFAALHRRWAETSAAMYARLGSPETISYGRDLRQCFDVWHGQGPGDGGAAKPCLAFIHGGYWQALNREDCALVVEPFVRRGITVAMIEYRLCPAVRMTDIVGDIDAAMAELFKLAPKLHIDPSRVVVGGHSAGGHLAAMLLTRSAAATAGVISISGLYDLEPIRLSFLNAALKMDADEARRLSPVLLRPARGVPLVLTLGADEPAEYQRQQTEFAAAWRKHGVTPRIVAVRGNHFDAMEALADEGQPLFAATLDLLGH